MASHQTYRAIVDACDEAIAKRLTEDEAIVSFTIDGEVVTKHGLGEILATRKAYSALAARALQAAGRGGCGGRTRANLGSR